MSSGERLLTTEELAARYGRSARTIEDWRYKRFGPPWIKVAGAPGGPGTVRYRESAVIAWERQQEKEAS